MAKRPDSVSVKFAQPLQLEAGAPLAVRIEPPPPPARLNLQERLLRGGLFALFLGLTVLAVWYTLQKQTAAPATLLNAVSVSYSAPQFVAVDDEAALVVSVSNQTSQPLTVTVALAFADAALPVEALPGETTATTIENLPPGALATRAIRFVLPERPRAQAVAFGFRAILPDGSAEMTAWDSLGVTPLVPRLKAALTWLAGGSGLLALALNFLWDRFVKRMFPES
jgi:hypothetical protein